MVTTPTVWQPLTAITPADGALLQSQSRIVALADGGYFVVWTDYSAGLASTIVGQRVDVLGSSVGTALTVAAPQGGEIWAAQADVTQLSDGRLGFGFEIRTNLNPSPDYPDDVYAGTSNAALTTFTRHSVETTLTIGSDAPVVTPFGNGSYLIAYTKLTSGGNSDVANIVTAGVVGPEITLFNNVDYQFGPAVATLSNGDFVAVGEVTGGNTDIKFVIGDATGTLSVMPTAVAGGADAVDQEFSPSVAALTGGGFVAAWYELGNDADVRASIYSNTGTLVAGNILVNTTTAGNQRYPVVTQLADGGFLVGWDDDLHRFRAQRFDASGDKVGNEFVLAEGPGFSLDLTLLKDGRVAVTLSQDTAERDVLVSIIDPREHLIDGTAGDDVLTARRDGAMVNGLGGADVLHGFESADVLDGGAGADLMVGRGGDDTYVVDNAGDVADESSGSGTDTVRAAISFSLADTAHAKGKVENLTLTGSAGHGTGTDGANVLAGNGGNNRLEAGAGKDHVAGGAGKDRLFGGDGADLLEGGKGKDKLYGDAGKDTLLGGRGADRLHAGVDHRKDVFVYGSERDSGHGSAKGWDKLYDFAAKTGNAKHTDKIDLSAFDTDTHHKHDQEFRFVDQFSKAEGKEPDGEVRVEDAGKNVKVLVDVDGDTHADMVMLVMHVDQLHKGDFIL